MQLHLHRIFPGVFTESALRLEKEAAETHLKLIKNEKEQVLIFMLEAQEFQNRNSVVSAGENAKILEEYLRYQEKALETENSSKNREKLNELKYLLQKCKDEQLALKDILGTRLKV